METNSRLTPSRAIHPGEILQQELESRNIKQKDFAKTIGVSASHLNDVLKGRRNFTKAFASKLANALGIPADHWMRLHYFYLQDLQTIAQRARSAERLSLANIIRSAIKRQGISNRQVAEIVGVTESEIDAYASGGAYPSLTTAGSLCLALGIPPATMLGL